MVKEQLTIEKTTPKQVPLVHSQKIIKLEFDTEKLKGFNPNITNAKKNNKNPTFVSKEFEVFKLAESNLILSKPKLLQKDDNETPDFEIINKNKNDEISLGKETPKEVATNSFDRNDIMNLDKEELKYLRTIVLKKHKDVHSEKHHRSRSRYGW